MTADDLVPDAIRGRYSAKITASLAAVFAVTVFVGVFLGVYIDVALYIGFGLLLLRTGDALDQLAGGTDGTRSRSDAGATDEAAASAD